MRVEKLAYGSIVLDTVTASAVQNGSRLEYALRVANAPGNLDNIALAGVYGHVVRNTGAVNFYQKNRAGREGFRFGVDAAWNDSLIRASVTPLAPVFGSEPWTVNPGNYLVYRFDGNLSADLDMTHGDQRFAIHTVPETDSLRGIRLDIAGLNIGGALAMLPSAPPVGGVLGAAVTLNTGADSLAVRGDVSVAGLSYDKQRFGDVGLGVRYAQGREQQADVRLTLDGADVLTARGDYRKERESPLDLTASIPGFPLQRADVFLPADMLRLSGILSGKAPRGRNAATAAVERRSAVRTDGGPRADDRHFVPSLFRHDPHRRQPGPVRRLCGHRPQQKPADDRRLRRSDRLRPHNGRHRAAGVGFPVRERGPEGGNGRLRESLSRSGRDGQRPSGRTRRPRQRRTAQKHRHQLCHAGLADGREGASAEHRDLRFVPRHGQPKASPRPPRRCGSAVWTSS